MSAGGFNSRAGGILVAVVGLSLIGGLILSVFADQFERVSIEADATSHSAIGHVLFRRFLEERGFEVDLSRARTRDRVTEENLLVIAEPRIEPDDDARIERLGDAVAYAGAVLLVLPKRTGWSSDPSSGHITGTGGRSERYVDSAFDIIGIRGSVTLSGVSSEDLEWISNDLGPAPEIEGLQLMQSDSLTPIVASHEGMLVGRFETPDYTRVYVLSDPDVIANHGLAKLANARFVDELMNNVALGELPVVIDESSHEIATPESIWEELLTMPLLLLTLTMVFLAGLLVWASWGSFGTVQRIDFGRRRGKHELIDNTARLLDLGQHSGHSLDRLLRHTQQDVAQALHAPADLDHDGRRNWIANAARSRRLFDEWQQLEVDVAELRQGEKRSTRSSVAVARRLFRWKEMMIHGSRSNTSGR